MPAPQPHATDHEDPSFDHYFLVLGESSLSPLERAQIRFIRASLRPGMLDKGIRALQGSVGQWWIRTVTASLRHVHGID